MIDLLLSFTLGLVVGIFLARKMFESEKHEKT